MRGLTAYMIRAKTCKSSLFGVGISAILILITLTSVEFNFQTFASQTITNSNGTLNAYDNTSQVNASTEISNFSTSNSAKTYNKDVISILSLN